MTSIFEQYEEARDKLNRGKKAFRDIHGLVSKYPEDRNLIVASMGIGQFVEQAESELEPVQTALQNAVIDYELKQESGITPKTAKPGSLKDTISKIAYQAMKECEVDTIQISSSGTFAHSKVTKTVTAPELTTLEHLFLFLRQCRCVMNRFPYGTPGHIMALRIEEYAVNKFAENDLKVPQAVMSAAKKRVHEKVKEDDKTMLVHDDALAFTRWVRDAA